MKIILKLVLKKYNASVWTELCLGRVQWPALVNTAMNFVIP
jgi:hypothetical protein